MPTVTDAAREYLADVLEQTEEDDCFRLVRSQEGRLAIVTGRATKSDVKIEHDDKTILAMDPEIADALEGRTIDLAGTPEGRKELVVT